MSDTRQGLREAHLALASIGDDALSETLRAYGEAALQTIQATRGYLFLANVVLAGQAAAFEETTALLRAEEVARRRARSGMLDTRLAGARRLAHIAQLSALLVAFGAAWLIGRSITIPLGRITDTFRRLADRKRRAADSGDRPPRRDRPHSRKPHRSSRRRIRRPSA